MTTLRSKNLFRSIPIFGGLADARAKDHVEAVVEIGLSTCFSTIPIWFGALILLAGKGASGTWWDLMVQNMRSGELWLYAAATLSPLYYFIFKDYKAAKHFPSGRSFITVSTVILLLSCGLFAVQRAESAFNLGSFLDHEFIFALSWKAYLLSVIVVYLAHVYRNFLETGAAALANSDTQSLVDQFLAEPKAEK